LQKNNCFITGGTGLLGSNWLFFLKKKYNVSASLNKKIINLDKINFHTVDLFSQQSLEFCLKKIKPHILIHTAALSNVENCQSDKKNAYKINVEITKNISKICSKLNIKLIYISTDHLFDGTKKFSSETEIKKPLNYYAETKNLAENYIIKHNKLHLIIRSNFFGWGTSYRKSFSDFIISNLRNEKTINLFDDVYFTPIIFSELFEKVEKLIISNKNGIYNVVGNERLSKYDFGMKIAKLFKLNNNLINKISISEMNNLIIRPLDMSLLNNKYKQDMNDNFKTIEESIKLLKDYENHNDNRILQCL